MTANPFVGGSYLLQHRKADVQRSVNLMPTPIESGSGKSQMYLMPTPGLVVFTTADGTPSTEPVYDALYRFTGITSLGAHTVVYDDVSIV